jgi:hypothetical protein
MAPCHSLWCGGMGMSKERDEVFLAFGVAGLPKEASATGY